MVTGRTSLAVAVKGSASSGGFFFCCAGDGAYTLLLPRPASGSDRAGLVGSRSAPTPPARPYFQSLCACLYWRYRASNEAGPATARSTKIA